MGRWGFGALGDGVSVLGDVCHYLICHFWFLRCVKFMLNARLILVCGTVMHNETVKMLLLGEIH